MKKVAIRALIKAATIFLGLILLMIAFQYPAWLQYRRYILENVNLPWEYNKEGYLEFLNYFGIDHFHLDLWPYDNKSLFSDRYNK
jgi:hypothetical protein